MVGPEVVLEGAAQAVGSGLGLAGQRGDVPLPGRDEPGGGARHGVCEATGRGRADLPGRGRYVEVLLVPRPRGAAHRERDDLHQCLTSSRACSAPTTRESEVSTTSSAPVSAAYVARSSTP